MRPGVSRQAIVVCQVVSLIRMAVASNLVELATLPRNRGPGGGSFRRCSPVRARECWRQRVAARRAPRYAARASWKATPFHGLNIYNANSRNNCWYTMGSGPILGQSLPLFVGETGIILNDVGGTLAARAAAFDNKFRAQFGAGGSESSPGPGVRSARHSNNYDIGAGDPALNVLGRY
jgi:hypothetical protein